MGSSPLLCLVLVLPSISSSLIPTVLIGRFANDLPVKYGLDGDIDGGICACSTCEYRRRFAKSRILEANNSKANISEHISLVCRNHHFSLVELC